MCWEYNFMGIFWVFRKYDVNYLWDYVVSAVNYYFIVNV